MFIINSKTYSPQNIAALFDDLRNNFLHLSGCKPSAMMTESIAGDPIFIFCINNDMSEDVKNEIQKNFSELKNKLKNIIEV